MARPRILFAFHTRDAAHREHCREFVEMSFIGPLGESGLADYDVFWYGPWMGDWKAMNLELLRRCAAMRPDALMLINGWEPEHDKPEAWYLRLLTLYLVRWILGVKVTALWTDQTREHFEVSDEVTRFCDVAFTHEDERAFRGYTRYPERHVVTNATFSPRLLHGDPAAARDIDLCFIGQVTGYEEVRARGLQGLREAGLAVHAPGGQGRDQVKLTNQAYGELLKRSKIALNWSRHISGQWFQAKARIFEATLAGALLLCEECDEVNRYFQPGVEYVPFTTQDQLIERARRYLGDTGERLRIAASGHACALAHYSAPVVWRQMLDEIGARNAFDPAEALAGLRRNASANELALAVYLRERLPTVLPGFEHSALEAAVEALGAGRAAFDRRARWRKLRDAIRPRQLARRLLRPT